MSIGSWWYGSGAPRARGWWGTSDNRTQAAAAAAAAEALEPRRLCASHGHDAGPATGSPTPAGGAAVSEQTVYVSKRKKLDVTLVADEGSAEIGGRTVTGVQTYNGLFPGPTLKLKAGDTLTVRLVNQLDEPTNLHFHGLHVSPTGDGDNVFLMADPGQTQDYTIEIPADHATGVFWYHPHHHGRVDAQIYAGLSGMLMVQGKDKLPAALSKLTTHNLGLKNAVITNDALDPIWLPSSEDAVYTVDGLVNPTLEMRRGEAQVWNVANLGNDAWYDLKFTGGNVRVLAEDGGLLARPREAEHVLLGPADRVMLLVQAPDAAGTYELRSEGYVYGPEEENFFPPVTLATVDVADRKAAANRKVKPAKLATMKLPQRYFEDLRNATVRATRTIQFDQLGDSVFGINGESFPNVPDVLPKLGSVEEWTVTNPTFQIHPFHLHTNMFQVISVNGAPTDDAAWQDTFPVPAAGAQPQGEIVVRVRFADYLGASVYHCHIPRHEDRGMMGVVTVIE